ncbi:hypothetical protein, partial [uncultured Dialister sp.]
VDHADTELIGHRGWEGTGFLCNEKAAPWRGCFFDCKKDSTKTRMLSVPDSIAGLSESGVNAEHTGKSCSCPEPGKHCFIRRIKFHMDFCPMLRHQSP